MSLESEIDIICDASIDTIISTQHKVDIPHILRIGLRQGFGDELSRTAQPTSPRCFAEMACPELAEGLALSLPKGLP
jgi:hypothetical protein